MRNSVTRPVWLLVDVSHPSLFVCHLVFNIPLHAARRAMTAALPLPLKATAGFYRYTNFLPPDVEAVIVGLS